MRPGAMSAVLATGTKPSGAWFIECDLASPSPASREREGPIAKRWEGEGLLPGRHPHPPRCARHPLPHCGRGVRGSVQAEAEHLGGVVRGDLAEILLRHALEHPFEELLRARERRLGMR